MSFHQIFLVSLVLIISSFSISSAQLPLPQKRCQPEDQKALLEIKAAFGSHLDSFKTWTQKTDCCRKWNGVLCKKLPKTNIRRVNFLEVIGEDTYVGQLPPVVANLPYLESLIIRLLPNMTGPIPLAISRLTKLTYLSLNWNALTGPVPSFLSELTKLGGIDLNDNHLTGPIPSSLGQLPHLTALDLTNNHLTGSIPASLGSLAGRGNNIFLQLSNNHLSGPIPRSLGKINFESIELAGNHLTGDASFLFGEDKTNLAHMDLSNNELSFDLSKVVMPVDVLSSSLSVLDLSHNKIYGHIPAWMGEAPGLYQLNLNDNQLCGRIPTAGGKLQTAFDPSSFANNKCLCGAPLPPCKS